MTRGAGSVLANPFRVRTNPTRSDKLRRQTGKTASGPKIPCRTSPEKQLELLMTLVIMPFSVHKLFA